MSYIPQRLRYQDFPVSGVMGITDREALDLAIDGQLKAYYLINTPFDLVGSSMIGEKYMIGSYGDFHGPFAQLPLGILSYLESHQCVTFDKSNPVQVIGFYHAEFGPPDQPENIRGAFEAEPHYWLLLEDDAQFKILLNQIVFMREDLKRIADSRQPKPEPDANKQKPSHLLAIAALLDLLQAPVGHPRPQGMNQSAIKSAILDKFNWRGLGSRTLDDLFADANKAKADAE